MATSDAAAERRVGRHREDAAEAEHDENDVEHGCCLQWFGQR
jgi:hypothetical protein